MSMIFYVSPAGCDQNPGTESLPFQTIERAQNAARSEKNATVCVQKGIYRTHLRLDARDNGTTYLGSDAILTGGLEVSPEQFSSPAPEILARLCPDAAKNVRAIDLRSYGFTPDDWGEVYPIGEYHTAEKYDNAKQGVNLEVFSGDKRMTLARYPNEGYCKIDNVLDVGDVWEYPEQNYFYDWTDRRNHRGGAYLLDKATNERIKTWQTPETAWIFGYLYHDWADTSSPIHVRPENRVVYPAYVSYFGCKKGADYYLYNVLEELDAPGEFYLDRDSGVLYVYPCSPTDSIEISLSTEPLISASGVEAITLDGFTLRCTRSNAVEWSGKDCTLKNLFVCNVAEHAISVHGYRNRIESCEITRTGRGGNYVEGGERSSLTPGENIVTNNYIHDFSEVYQTYQAGIFLGGVGNICSHNEISHSPHMAVYYKGNEHLIEYNNIHDVVLYSSDAGAIYAGYDWCGHGTVIRYNILRDIGRGDLHPDGIYWDDGLSGQSAYGNILINVTKFAIHAGGGRDLVIRDNIILGDSRSAIHYDDRNRDGFVHGGWAKAAVNHPDAKHWQNLRAIPYTAEPWKTKYPTLSELITDFSQYDDPRFPVNPAGSVVENNIVIRSQPETYDIYDSVYQYSTIGENPQYTSCTQADFDPETLTFLHPRPDFPSIPVERIGRGK